MPAAATMAQTFYTPSQGEFVPDFIERHSKHTPWKRQSVAVVLLSPDWRNVALVLPRKVLQREAENRIRVPIQGRLTGRRKNPIDDARIILEQKAELHLRVDALHYIGFGYTRSFCTNELQLQYNKLLHFVYGELAHMRRLPRSTTYAEHLEWFPVDTLQAIVQASMDERKAWLFMQALERVAAVHTATAPRLRRVLSR